MPRHPIPKTNLFSTTCKRCQWFQNKSTAKKLGCHINTNAIGRCLCCNREDIFERVVPAGMVPCPNFIFKPCTSGNSYAVMNIRTMQISFITPIKIEAKLMAEKANNQDIVAVEIKRIK